MASPRPKLFGFVLIILFSFSPIMLNAGIHTVPIIYTANELAIMRYHKLSSYRLFRTDSTGKARTIPFQIDEKDRYSDYILDNGKNQNSAYSNQRFDGLDELSFMGNDVGLVKVPTNWGVYEPDLLYEIKMTRGKRQGAVYLGVFYRKAPPKSPLSYVSYSPKQAEILTSRYRYRFSHKNYLVVRGIEATSKTGYRPLISSSTFFLNANLKYFLTLAINEQSIESELDAYHAGPIRAIARVNFNYQLLQLNFDLGMYTEVSFFPNAVLLPAVIDNPFDGKKVFNNSSEFYYGLSLINSPSQMEIASNMPPYHRRNSNPQSPNDAPPSSYWLTAVDDKTMVYLELTPSQAMIAKGNIPSYYVESKSAKDMEKRSRNAQPLGRSPVNMAISFKLANLSKGLHDMRFRLFLETKRDAKIMEEYKTLDEWKTHTRRVKAFEFRTSKTKKKAPIKQKLK